MDAILGLLGICGANCAEDRDADSKGRTEGVVSCGLCPQGPPCVKPTASDSYSFDASIAPKKLVALQVG